MDNKRAGKYRIISALIILSMFIAAGIYLRYNSLRSMPRNQYLFEKYGNSFTVTFANEPRYRIEAAWEGSSYRQPKQFSLRGVSENELTEGLSVRAEGGRWKLQCFLENQTGENVTIQYIVLEEYVLGEWIIIPDFDNDSFLEHTRLKLGKDGLVQLCAQSDDPILELKPGEIGQASYHYRYDGKVPRHARCRAVFYLSNSGICAVEFERS